MAICTEYAKCPQQSARGTKDDLRRSPRHSPRQMVRPRLELGQSLLRQSREPHITPLTIFVSPRHYHPDRAERRGFTRSHRATQPLALCPYPHQQRRTTPRRPSIVCSDRRRSQESPSDRTASRAGRRAGLIGPIALRVAAPRSTHTHKHRGRRGAVPPVPAHRLDQQRRPHAHRAQAASAREAPRTTRAGLALRGDKHPGRGR